MSATATAGTRPNTTVTALRYGLPLLAIGVALIGFSLMTAGRDEARLIRDSVSTETRRMANEAGVKWPVKMPKHESSMATFLVTDLPKPGESMEDRYARRDAEKKQAQEAYFKELLSVVPIIDFEKAGSERAQTREESGKRSLVISIWVASCLIVAWAMLMTPVAYRRGIRPLLVVGAGLGFKARRAIKTETTAIVTEAEQTSGTPE